MASAGINVRVGTGMGHALCPFESYEEVDLCPHAVYMALRMEDGKEVDVMNAWAGRRQWTE